MAHRPNAQAAVVVAAEYADAEVAIAVRRAAAAGAGVAIARMRVIIAIVSRGATQTHHDYNDERHQEQAAHNAGQNAKEWPDVLDDGCIGQR